MVLLTELPEEIFFNICKHLDLVQDIVNFEASHPSIEKKIYYTFWGQPKTLILSDNYTEFGGLFNTPRIATADGQHFMLPTDDDSFISDIILKMRNLQEIYLGPLKRTDIMRRILFVLLESNLRLQKIVILYNRPESLLDSSSKSRELWPSKSSHRKLVELIKQQKETLNFLGLILGLNEYVSILWSPKRDRMSLEYHYTGSMDTRYRVVYPFLFNFTNTTSIPITLDISIKAQTNVAHFVLAHCIHSCVPHNHRYSLRNVHVRMFSANLSTDASSIFTLGAAIGDFKRLATVSFYFDEPGMDKDGLDEICNTSCSQSYDLKLSTPTYHRLVHKSVLIPCPLAHQPLLYCAS
uniref:F-box domain-containing protein n=2 Tax=Acrobeloides nanus TaxID=290746 RepID=A0A914DET0_9BILA